MNCERCGTSLFGMSPLARYCSKRCRKRMSKRRKRLGVQRPDVDDLDFDGRCRNPECKRLLVGRQPQTRYCTSRCRNRASEIRRGGGPRLYVCELCATPFIHATRGGAPKSCPEHREELARRRDRVRKLALTPEERHEQYLRNKRHRTPEQIERNRQRNRAYHQLETPEHKAARLAKAKADAAARRAAMTPGELEAKREYDRQRRRLRTPEDRRKRRAYVSERDKLIRNQAAAYRRIMSLMEEDHGRSSSSTDD